MAFDSKKTILLEKTYLYVRASLGFQLEGTSTEKIPTNNGFYRFFVDNLQKAIGNSYVNILYDSQDLTLQCFCSDLYMDELMSSDSSAIEDVVEELKKNTSSIVEFESGVSSALASNHEDNVLLHADLNSISSFSNNLYDTAKNLCTPSFKWFPQFGHVFMEYVSPSDFVKSYNGLYVATFKRTFDITSSPFAKALSGGFQFVLDFGFNLPDGLSIGYGQNVVIYDSLNKSFFSSVKSDSKSTSSSYSYVTLCSIDTASDKKFIASYVFSVSIPSELYNIMVFRQNSFSDNYSFYERSNFGTGKDSIFLYVEPNSTTCIFSHKLDIKKHFDSEKTYDLTVYVPTSLSADYLNTIPSIYVFVNGSEISFPATLYTKLEGGKKYYTYSLSFTGSNSYRISSISFNSIWDS